MVHFDLLPGNPLDKSSPSGPGVGNCLKRSYPGVGGVGKIKSDFSLTLRSTFYFSPGLHEAAELKITYFQENLSENGWRGIIYQN